MKIISNGILVEGGVSTKLVQLALDNDTSVQSSPLFAGITVDEDQFSIEEVSSYSEITASVIGKMNVGGSSYYFVNADDLEISVDLYHRSPFHCERVRTRGGVRVRKTGFVFGPKVSEEARPGRACMQYTVGINSIFSSMPSAKVPASAIFFERDGRDDKEIVLFAVSDEYYGSKGVPVNDDFTKTPAIENYDETLMKGWSRVEADGKVVAFVKDGLILTKDNYESYVSFLPKTIESTGTTQGPLSLFCTTLGMRSLIQNKEMSLRGYHFVFSYNDGNEIVGVSTDKINFTHFTDLELLAQYIISTQIFNVPTVLNAKNVAGGRK